MDRRGVTASSAHSSALGFARAGTTMPLAASGQGASPQDRSQRTPIVRTADAAPSSGNIHQKPRRAKRSRSTVTSRWYLLDCRSAA